MLAAFQRIHPIDGNEVGAYARDAGAHPVQHLAKLLDVGFAGGVVDGGAAFREHGGHHDVGGTGNGSLIEQHVAACQAVGLNRIEKTFGIVFERGAEFLNADEVGVEPSTADFVAARLGNHGFAETGHQWAYQHDGTTQGCAFFKVIFAVKLVQINFVRTETPGTRRGFQRLDPDVLHQTDEVVDVDDVGNVFHDHFVGREQAGTEYLERLVLCTLGFDFALHFIATVNNE